MRDRSRGCEKEGVLSSWLESVPLQRVKCFIREIVSKEKLRFKDNGFNLDLSYITPRIIAMGFPSEGTEALYRNAIPEVLSFLNEFHEKHFKVFNLCAEKTYDPAKLGGNVEWIPFSDHDPAPTDLMLYFCERAHDWLMAESSNVIVVHCKAGKGRTGLMICAYLVYSQECGEPITAIRTYGEKRTKNGKGVTIPSQRRYLDYFYDICKHGKRNLVSLMISKIVFYSNLSYKSGIRVCIACNAGNNSFKLNSILESRGTGSAVSILHEGRSVSFIFSPEVRISGDVKISICEAGFSRKTLLYFWFNTSFVDSQMFVLSTKSEMDKPVKTLDDDTQVHVFFSSRARRVSVGD